jgi:hypothetical protein
MVPTLTGELGLKIKGFNLFRLLALQLQKMAERRKSLAQQCASVSRCTE